MPNNEFQVLIQAIIDAKDVQTRLNAIKDLSIKIEKINLDQSAINSLRNQLSKNGIDVNLVLGNVNQIQSQATKAGQQIGQKIQTGLDSVIQKGDFKKVFGAATSDLNNTGKVAEKYFQTLSNGVSIQEKLGKNNNLESFIVTLKNANGVAEQLRYTLREINDKNGNIIDRQFEYTGGTINDNGVIKQFTTISTAADNLQIKLNKLKANYSDLNATKAIKNPGHISSLEQQYNKVFQSISKLKTADDNTFASMQTNVKSEIACLENMIQQFRNAENVSSKLKGTDFSSGLSIARNDLEKFKSDAKDFPQITKTIQELDTAISQVGNVATLNKFIDQLRVARSELAKVKSETASLNRNEKIGINVSSLASKISDIQRTNPQIDNFEAQINGAKVSVQSLLDDLSKVNTQGDFSVINNKFKAFTAAAKAAGIATAEITLNSNSINESSAITKIDELTAKFKNLGFTEDEIGQKMQSITAAYGQLQMAISTNDSKSIVTANKQFNSSLKETSNLYRQIKADSTSFYNATKQTKLSNDIQNWMSKNTAATKQAKASLNAFLGELNNGRVNVARLQEIQTQFQQIDTQMRSIGRLGNSFRQTFTEGIKKFSYWTSSTFLVMKTIQEIKQAVTKVKELDTALVDLKKTSTMTTTQLKDFYYSANDVAKQMGVTTKQIIEQAAAWSRLGFSNNEAATQMAKYSSMFASISPGMDIDQATDGLVSVIKAFDIETDGVLDGIMSKINIIGNNKALNNNDIVDFLTRSSSAMAEANNSLEETIALGTAATEITRDAASVGQVLKTTSMRIRGYDEEAESYTEELENLKGEIASLTKTAKTPGGISLFSDETKETYKSTYQILEEISSIWDDLTDKNQANDMCLCA